MKVILPLISLAILGMVAYVVVAAEEAAKTEVSVKGEVVDLHCFLTAGARGPGHKACAIACAKARQPDRPRGRQGRGVSPLGQGQE
jgi:hypothetical protein